MKNVAAARFYSLTTYQGKMSCMLVFILFFSLFVAVSSLFTKSRFSHRASFNSAVTLKDIVIDEPVVKITTKTKEINITDVATNLINVAISIEGVDETDLRFDTIHKLIDTLESKYIPIQTATFMSFALSGTWKHVYTNFLTPKRDKSL